MIVLALLGILLGVLAFILRNAQARDQYDQAVSYRPMANALVVTAIVLFAIGFIGATIVIVPAGHRGVLLRFQAVRGVLPEGIHLVMPYINTVRMIEVRTQKEESSASAASKDLQIVTTGIALNFHILPSAVGDLYKNVGMDYKDRIIDPSVQEVLKMVTAQYTAEELIKNRSEVKEGVESAITKRLAIYNIMVEPSGLSITDFQFSPEFNSAIEAKQVAQQEAEKQRYILQRAELEKQTAITKAQGASEAAKLNAAALQAQGGNKVIAREWIEKWDGHLPSVMNGEGMIIDISSIMKQAGN